MADASPGTAEAGHGPAADTNPDAADAGQAAAPAEANADTSSAGHAAAPPVDDPHADLSEEELALMGADAPSPAEGSTAGSGFRALVGGSSEKDRTEIADVLAGKGFEVATAPGLRETVVELDGGPFDLVVVSIAATHPQALGVLRELAAHRNGGTLLLATRRPTPGLVFQAVRAGADYVVVLPPTAAAIDHIMGLLPARMAA